MLKRIMILKKFKLLPKAEPDYIYVWNELLSDEELRVQKALGTIYPYKVSTQAEFPVILVYDAGTDSEGNLRIPGAYKTLKHKTFAVCATSEEQAIEIVGPYLGNDFKVMHVELMTDDAIFNEISGRQEHDYDRYD